MRKGFKDFERFNIIEFNKNGYPTTKSLRQLKKELASEDPKIVRSLKGIIYELLRLGDRIGK